MQEKDNTNFDEQIRDNSKFYITIQEFAGRGSANKYKGILVPINTELTGNTLFSLGFNKTDVKKHLGVYWRLKTDADPLFPDKPYNIDIELAKRDQQQELEEKKRQELAGFIFDENEVWRKSAFPFVRLKEEVMAFGLRLPKIVTYEDHKGRVDNTSQEDRPVLITSAHNLKQIGKELNKEYKVKIEGIPEFLNRRWSLSSIHAWLSNKSEQVNAKELLQTIKQKYVDNIYFYDQNWHDVHALWDIGTYFFWLFDAYPLMEMRGLAGTGKTRVMQISSLISFNATKPMINPSEATLFRETNDTRCTKYIDEAERLFAFDPKTKQVIADPRAELINASYQKGAAVPRQEKFLNKFKTVWYEVYSPTMIGSINGLFGATETRAIVHTMIKIPDANNCGENSLPDTPGTTEQAILDKLYVFALQNWQQVDQARKSFRNETKLRARDFLIWKPILTLAKFFDEELYKRLVPFAEHLTQIKQVTAMDTETIEFKALVKVWEFLSKGQTEISLKEILAFWPEDDRPHTRTLSTRLDKLGLRDFKEHFETGNGYRITQSDFRTIIEPQYPSIFASSSSLSSVSYTNKLNIAEHAEDNVSIQKTIFSEADEADEADEDKLSKQGNSGKLYSLALSIVDKNGLADQQQLAELFGEGFEEALSWCLTQGKVYQPKPGKLAVFQ